MKKATEEQKTRRVPKRSAIQPLTGIKTANATEPVTAAELYKTLTGEVFKNELKGTPAKYDFRTKYASVFGGKGGYICSKEEIMADIKLFVRHMIMEGERG